MGNTRNLTIEPMLMICPPNPGDPDPVPQPEPEPVPAFT